MQHSENTLVLCEHIFLAANGDWIDGCEATSIFATSADSSGDWTVEAMIV